MHRHFVPVGLRVYAIGDVHGCLSLLLAKLRDIETDLVRAPCADHLIVCLGDYVDRGASSADVLQVLVERSASEKFICLQGNHEHIMMQFLRGHVPLHAWIGMGGQSTLLSYGIKPSADRSEDYSAALRAQLLAAVPSSHLDFLARLRPMLQVGSCVFVHAGLKPGVELADQRTLDLLWIRDEFLSWPNPFEHLVVHGHTPVHEPEVCRNRINIDTGAYATGRLTCLVLEGTNGRFL